MASPSPSQQRGNLISQLSRGRVANSTASSPPRNAFNNDENTGTMSSFAPEHESTQQFDTATQDQLPNLRSSAQRFAYYQPAEPQAHINTSFVRDGFPDFTQHTPLDDDYSTSIELGRGVKRGTRNTPNKADAYEDISENPILSMDNDSLYEVTGTPPVRPRNDDRKTGAMGRNSLRKEASVRRAVTAPQPADLTVTSHLSKTSDFAPAKARLAGASQRRTLSDMHAKVNAETESSYVGEERPVTSAASAKNTRFARSRQTSAPQHNIPTRFTSGQGLTSGSETPQRPTQNANPNLTGNQTQLSFMLPDLPNITELVSGVRKDGTPVFPRTTKSRSRFASGSYNPTSSNDTVTYAKIHSIAVPEEEKAIFASLQLLKEKVAQLETEKSEATKRLEEYENEVIELKSKVQMEQKLRRPDSALGSDEEMNARDKWRVERSKLQSTVKILQDRLDKTERKVSVSDIAVNRLTEERDNLVTQLGVAYYNSEELKLENEQLQTTNQELQRANKGLLDENEATRAETSVLRVKLAHIKAQFQDETQQWSKREKSLRGKIERREATVQELQDLTRELPAHDSHPAQNMRRRRSSGRLGEDTKNKIMDRIQAEVRKARVDSASTSSRSRNVEPSRSVSQPQSNERELKHSYQRQSSGPRERTRVVESDLSEAESTTDLPSSRIAQESASAPQQDRADENDSRDITFLSHLDARELARLRKKLEEELRAARQPRSAPTPLSQQDDATRTRTNIIPRKSSLRDVSAELTTGRNHDGTTNFTKKTQFDEEATGLTRNVRIQSPHTSDAISYEEAKDSVDASMMSTASRRRQRSKSIEEMTSAFILPDITLHKHANAPAFDIEATAQNVAHDRANCTFCPTKDSEANASQPFTPVPVTDRDIDETNATIRPSQPPPIALANVLKQLHDEVAHLKLRLAALEGAYNAHDPALGRRKRKAVKQKMEALIAEIDRRSDQIYSLYDVLEGQKQADAGAADREGEAAAEMDEADVEETLQSLGIDANDLARRASRANQTEHKSAGLYASGGTGIGGGLDRLIEESDDELPWEGISDESETEGTDVGAHRRRSVGA
ncbi:hypothetical protein MBLNU459_g8535t1 [Dothideomycetes sp. NU459]